MTKTASGAAAQREKAAAMASSSLGVAQPVRDRLLGEARVAHPVGPQPAPPRPRLGVGVGPRRARGDHVGEPGLVRQPEQPGPDARRRARCAPSPRRYSSSQRSSSGSAGRPGEGPVVGVTGRQHAVGAQHPAQLHQRGHRVGEMLEHLVQVDHVERGVGVAEGEEVAHLEAQVGQAQAAGVLLRPAPPRRPPRRARRPRPAPPAGPGRP